MNTPWSRRRETVDRLFNVLESRLAHIFDAIENQSTAANLRLDKVSSALDSLGVVATAQMDSQRRQIDLLHRLASGIDRDVAPAKEIPARLENSTAPVRPVAPNALEDHQAILDNLKPWSGDVPQGFLVDFIGVLTDASFRRQYGIDPLTSGGAFMTTRVPQFENANAEWWFETINWFESALEAKDRYVMMTLGACYGAQAVGAHRALQMVNPMPSKLVAVEPDLDNYQWMRQHFRDNGIDPDDHWLVQTAISDRNDAVLFPAGAAGSGANNCFSTNDGGERRAFAERLIAAGQANDVLRHLMVDNTTGVVKQLMAEREAIGMIRYVSSVTLKDLLAPFDFVDYVEADMQQSEVVVFPPYIDLLRQKVRRIHIGTHGAETHKMLHELFAANGWDIIFSFAPDLTHDSKLGQFITNDGVLTVRNPDF